MSSQRYSLQKCYRPLSVELHRRGNWNIRRTLDASPALPLISILFDRVLMLPRHHRCHVFSQGLIVNAAKPASSTLQHLKKKKENQYLCSFPSLRAFIARANISQVVPCIETGLVPVAPRNLNRIITDRNDRFYAIASGLLRLWRRVKRMQQHCFSLALRARTLIPKIAEGEWTYVPVIPRQGHYVGVRLFDRSHTHRQPHNIV